MTNAEILTKIAENEPKVFAAGKQKQLQEFWKSFQSEGNRQDYHYAFAGYGWKEATFKPMYNMNTSVYGAYGMFFNNLIGGSLKQILNDLNITLNTTKSKHFTNMFDGSAFTEIPTIDMSNAVNTSYVFSACTKLNTIEKIISSENTVWNSTSFYNCVALVNITFEGVVAKPITLENSTLLSAESAVSLFNALKDLTGTDLSYTVTFSTALVNRLTDEQKAIATNKGWTLLYK